MRLLTLSLLLAAPCPSAAVAVPQLVETDTFPLVSAVEDKSVSAGDLWIGGDELLVASPWDDEILQFERGAAGAWEQRDSILSAWTSGSPTQLFGSSISIDGSRAAFAQGQYFEGGIAIYERDWSPQLMIGPPPGASSGFGQNVALSGDWLVANDYNGPNGGVLHFFRNSVGTTWLAEQELDTHGDAQSLGWGGVVFAGDQVLVGDLFNEEYGSTSGAVYVFELGGDGEWFERQKLTASDAKSHESFGGALDVSGDTAAIGAANADPLGDSSGAVYLFERQPDGSWLETQKIFAADLEEGDTFGNDVDIEGELVLIGAQRKDDVGNRSGAAYVFQRQFGTWVEVQKINASDASGTDMFGEGVYLSEDRALITPSNENALYVFDPNLLANQPGLSLAAGGTQSLSLKAGAEHADELYWVVGSATGTVPGIFLGSELLPLNPDAYTTLTLTQPNQGPFVETLAALDEDGRGTARIAVPPLAQPALIGLELQHAFLTIAASGQVTHTSNAAALVFEP